MFILAAVFYFLLAVGGHAFISRLPIGGNRVVKFLGIGGFWGVVLILGLFRIGASRVDLAAALFVYAFLSELYIFSFTFAASSISARLLFTLQKGAMCEDEINQLYDTGKMVDRRFENLIHQKCIQQKNGKYALTLKGLLLVNGFRRLQSFFKIK